MLSFWEKDTLVNYDVIIIGGGIVGLSTAASLIEQNKQQKILVLERGIFPLGASTKNAGFACFGSLTELVNDVEKMGEKMTIQLVQQRWNGLKKLRERLTDKAIGYYQYGGYELLNADNEWIIEKIDPFNRMLSKFFDKKVFHLRNELIEEFGFLKKQVSALVYNPLEGQLHVGKMMQSLWSYVNKIGVKIITGANVIGFQKMKNKIKILVGCPFSNEKIIFYAKKMAICTNAFTKKLLPDISLSPGRGQILITKPIENLTLKGSFHMEQGYFYFRNYKNRILIGGGRNLDSKREETTDFGTSDKIIENLKQKLSQIVIPNRKYEIEQIWSGIMAFSDDGNKESICHQIDEGIFMGVRLGGMGVAIGSDLGEKLAIKILNS